MVDRRFLHSEYSAHIWAKKRADEWTRTADLLITRASCPSVWVYAESQLWPFEDAPSTPFGE